MSDFTNSPVSAEALPDFSTVPLNRLVRAYLPYALTASLLFALLVGLAALVAGWFLFTLKVGLVLLGVGVFCLLPALCLHAFMEYRIFAWAVREHDLINREGVVWRKLTVLPFSRIQHVSTGNGPLERAFGLMHLKCFSAGGASADVTVQGLTPETAERLRQFILSRISGEDSTDGDNLGRMAEDQDSRPPEPGSDHE